MAALLAMFAFFDLLQELESVGKGTYGTVVKAICNKTKKEIAIKKHGEEWWNKITSPKAR